MSYAHETCCAHLKIQYCRESLEGLTHDWWECASCKMLFAPQGRASLPQWIPISERMPTREDADEHGLVRYQSYNRARWVGLWNGSRVEYDNEPATHWHSLPLYTPPKPGPTDTECANILHYSALVCANHLDPKDDVPRSEQFAMVRRWFADVTARIEKEKTR